MKQKDQAKMERLRLSTGSLILNLLCFSLSTTTRDEFLKSSISLITAAAPTNTNLPNHHDDIRYKNRNTILLTLEDAIGIIARHTTPPFLHAIRSAGGNKPLYRGENTNGECALMTPKPDLLLLDTYGDANALEYFRGLETLLTEMEEQSATTVNDNGDAHVNACNVDSAANGVFVAKPSTGHIATSSALEAQNWGDPMTVWPLGKELSFVYPTRRKLFYQDSTTTARKDTCEDLQVNCNLKEALEGGKEVMFATRDTTSTTDTTTSRFGGSISSSAYIVVPETYNRELLSVLSRSSSYFSHVSTFHIDA